MGKILLLAIAARLIYAILKRYSRSVSPPGMTREQAETMAQCAHCGLHIPKSESISADGKDFCSESHRAVHLQDAGS